MSDITQPNATFNIVGANTKVENTSQRILVIGQKLAAGSVSEKTLEQNIGVNVEENLFGAGSMLSRMIKTVRTVNEVTPLDVIPLDDHGSAVQAGASLSFPGSFTNPGTVSIQIGDRTYSIAVAAGTAPTPTALAAAFETLIDADSNSIVTSTASTTNLALLAKNGGTLGNSINIEIDDGGTGYGVVIASKFSGGSTNPDLSTILDLIGNIRYQTILWPYGSSAEVGILEAVLSARFNIDNRILDGVGITALISTQANAQSVAGSLNSPHIVMLLDADVDETTYSGPSVNLYLPSKIAKVGAIRALRLSDGENISRFVISGFGPRDSFGGPAIASKPYFNTPLPGVPTVGVGRGYSSTELPLVTSAGGSVIGNNASSNSVILGPVVTTYQTDAAGNPDVSFKYLNYVDTASNAREYFFNNLRKRFSQSRLTTGDVVGGRDQANADVIRSYVEVLYQDLSGPDYVLVEAGENAISFFKDNLQIIINTATGTATLTMQVPIVTQLRAIVATMQISFGLNS